MPPSIAPEFPLSITILCYTATGSTALRVARERPGLPVIGLMLHNYKNANVVSRYGGVIEHSYSVRIE